VVEAESHGDAEAIGYKIGEKYGFKDVDVFAVFRSRFYEIVERNPEGECYFRAKVIDIFTDDNGEEKERSYDMLFLADDLKEAMKIITEYMEQGYNMRLDAVGRTRIEDYIKA